MNPHLLVGAHALNALPGNEQTESVRHLRGCGSCAAEVAEMTETAARLGDAVSRHPRSELRTRTLTVARNVRQLPPHAGPLASNATDVLRAQGVRKAGWLISAACLVAAAVFGVHSTEADWRPDASTSRPSAHDRFGDFLTTSDLQLVTGSGPTGAKGTLAIARTENKMMFLAEGLPELARNQVYQLWFTGTEGFRPAGLLSSADQPAPLSTDGLAGVQEVVLTVEPGGGSPEPTGPAVVTISLA